MFAISRWDRFAVLSLQGRSYRGRDSLQGGLVSRRAARPPFRQLPQRLSMKTLNTTPRADGFHMPAEWAPQTQVWMVWPERPDNWRLGGKPAQAAHVTLAKAIARFEPVTVAVSAGQYENARRQLDVPNIRGRDQQRRRLGA
jgi:hypothetical protein